MRLEHLGVLHEQLRVHGGMALSWGLLYHVLVLVNMNWRIFMHDFRMWIDWCVPTLRLVIQSPLKNLLDAM